MKYRNAVPLLLALGLVPQSALHAQGQTAQTTFRVSATVNAVCEITASDLSFGTYSAQSEAALVGTTILNATCTPGTTYNIGLDAGTSSGATVTARKMASGANLLTYQLYSDSQRSTIWGNTPGTDTVADVGIGTAKPHTVYGTVPAKQSNIAAGIYQDTITVRIYY